MRALMALALVLPALPASAQPAPLPVVPADRGVDDRSAPDAWLATTEGFRTFSIDAVHATERLGGLPEYLVSVSTLDTSVDEDDLLGQPVTFALRTGPASFLVRSGHVFVVGRAETTTRADGTPMRRFSLEISPWARALALTTGYATYERMTATDVVRAVLARYPFARVDFRLRNGPRQHELFVQYRESDFEFIDRVLSNDGLFYLFEHDAHGVTLVVTDSFASTHGAPRVLTHEDRGSGTGVHARTYRGLGTTAYRASGVDAQHPERSISVQERTSGAAPFGPLVVTEHFPDDSSRALLQRRARAGAAALETSSRLSVEMPGAMALGATFVLRGHPSPSVGGEYRVIASSFTAEMYHRRVGEPLEIQSSLEAIPQTRPFGMMPSGARMTSGAQLATVIAPADASGRVRVRFPWGPGPDGELPSAWVRVLGARRPNAGDAVLVYFLDGDPARPLIAGF